MDKATTPRGDLADAVMSFQVLINVRPFFCFFGAGSKRLAGWPIRRCDLIPARSDMWPIGVHVLFFLSLSLALVPSLPLTCCSPARPQTHTVGEIDSGG